MEKLYGELTTCIIISFEIMEKNYFRLTACLQDGTSFSQIRRRQCVQLKPRIKSMLDSQPT